MTELDGKIAVSTGGARGQGRAHATTLARAGADIVVCDIAAPVDGLDYPLSTPADLEQTVHAVQALGRRCPAVTADVRDLAAMQSVVDRAIDEYGGIDIAVATGGLLTAAALRGRDTRGWFLASGGADAADLLGGMSVHHEMTRSQRLIGLGGAGVGIAVGLWGATRRRPAQPESPAGRA